MQIAGREISIYEILNGGRARWYWDRRYITEAEQEAMQEPVALSLIEEIDISLSKRWKEELWIGEKLNI